MLPSNPWPFEAPGSTVVPLTPGNGAAVGPGIEVPAGVTLTPGKPPVSVLSDTVGRAAPAAADRIAAPGFEVSIPFNPPMLAAPGVLRFSKALPAGPRFKALGLVGNPEMFGGGWNRGALAVVKTLLLEGFFPFAIDVMSPTKSPRLL